MKNYTEFTEGEITIYCGENAKHTVNESLKLASKISKSKRKGNILYINTVYSVRKLLAAARLEFPSPGNPGEELGVREGVIFQNICKGELCKYFSTITSLIESANVQYVIINSWEYANKSHTYKEKAIFELKGLLAEHGISLLIFSQSKSCEAGTIQRGGLGKLAGIADEIIQLDKPCNMKSEEANSQPHTPILPSAHTPANKKLLPSKINDLTYPRSEISVASGGELVLQEEEVEIVVRGEEIMVV